MPPTPITIRLDDERRHRLESTARLQDQTVSDTVRVAIDAYLGLDGAGDRQPTSGETTTPRSLPFLERRIMSLLFEALARVTNDDYEREEFSKRSRIIAEGHTGLYGEAFVDVWPEMPYADCRLVWDILDMFRVLSSSWRDLATGKELPQDLKFRGFDGNDSRESRMLGFTERLLEAGRYSEQRERFTDELDRGNSHMPTLAIYQRMLRAFSPIWEGKLRGSDDFSLTHDEIEQIRTAVPYPK